MKQCMHDTRAATAYISKDHRIAEPAKKKRSHYARQNTAEHDVERFLNHVGFFIIIIIIIIKPQFIRLGNMLESLQGSRMIAHVYYAKRTLIGLYIRITENAPFRVISVATV